MSEQPLSVTVGLPSWGQLTLDLRDELQDAICLTVGFHQWVRINNSRWVELHDIPPRRIRMHFLHAIFTRVSARRADEYTKQELQATVCDYLRRHLDARRLALPDGYSLADRTNNVMEA